MSAPEPISREVLSGRRAGTPAWSLGCAGIRASSRTVGPAVLRGSVPLGRAPGDSQSRRPIYVWPVMLGRPERPGKARESIRGSFA
jgi:hypothetical protein